MRQRKQCTVCGEFVTLEGLVGECPRCGHVVNADEVAAVAEETQEIPFATEHRGWWRGEYWWLVGAVWLIGALGVIVGVDIVRTTMGTRGQQQAAVAPASAQSAVASAPEVAPVAPAPAPAPVPATRTAMAIAEALVPAEAGSPASAHATTVTTTITTTAPVKLQLVKQKRKGRGGVSDAEIEAALRKGVDFLHASFIRARPIGADRYDPETFAGMHALCAYALLQAGETLRDPRLDVKGTFMSDNLKRIKTYPMDKDKATYSRSLRIMALAMKNRPEDRGVIAADAKWLMDSSMRGAFTYTKPVEGATHDNSSWDNSNSQYAALGLWAASEVEVIVPRSVWSDIERHWTEAQTPHSGSWGYTRGWDPSLSMTSAGVTTLFVTRDMLTRGSAAGSQAASLALSDALTRGLEWMDEEHHAVNVQGMHPGYTLYGMERAGLASGYKYFGDHDWYLELARWAIDEQNENGSWDGGDGPLVETAFTILFLARGRHPIFISKLRFEGKWNNTPRDAAYLTKFAGGQLERQLNWEVVGLQREWADWTDGPALYLASDEAVKLNDDTLRKLREYVEFGGLLFTHADGGSKAFNEFAEDLAKQLFPQYAMQTLPPDHAIYSLVFNAGAGKAAAPALRGVSNGSRLLMVHSPTDLAKGWAQRAMTGKAGPGATATAMELAANIVLYAAGKRDLHNRAESIVIGEPTEKPVGEMAIARVKYRGNWDPEPGAWKRMARLFEWDTSVKVVVGSKEISDLRFEKERFAHLTGTSDDEVKIAPDEAKALREFIEAGGVLLVDECGGSGKFTARAKAALIGSAFPEMSIQSLPADHPILLGRAAGMEDVSKPKLRLFAVEKLAGKVPSLQMIKAGKGLVIISDVDVSSGFLGTSTWGIAGYEAGYAQGLMKNILLWRIGVDERSEGTAPSVPR